MCVSLSELIFYFINVFLGFSLVYQAYINLFINRYTKYGFDALLLKLILVFVDQRRKNQFRKKFENIENIRKMGVIAIILACGFIYTVIEWGVFVIGPLLKVKCIK
jgi:hypothetical protein